MKIVGRREKIGDVNTPLSVVVVSDDGAEEPLDLRLDLWNHSPTGFECGYGGSGPAQLALAIIARLFDNDDLAIALHQDFKRRYVASFPRNGFEFEEQKIRDMVDSLG